MSEVALQSRYRTWFLEDMRSFHHFKLLASFVAASYANEAAYTLDLLGGMAGEW